MIRLILFIFLIGIPIAEIAVFIWVGSIIGAIPTILIIILTAIIGAGLLKRQGIAALGRLRNDVENNKVPAGSIGETLTVALAGILLLTPGFITDAVGFALFLPSFRHWLGRRIAGSIQVERGNAAQPGRPGATPRGGNKTIDLDEGEYSRADPDSPWHDRPKD
ncbi:MAG: membrane protein FxsA [Acuticoccus sp.]